MSTSAGGANQCTRRKSPTPDNRTDLNGHVDVAHSDLDVERAAWAFDPARQEWAAAEFTTWDDARPWIDAGLTPVQAKEWRYDSALTPEQARWMLDLHEGDDDAAWDGHGYWLQPDEATAGDLGAMAFDEVKERSDLRETSDHSRLRSAIPGRRTWSFSVDLVSGQVRELPVLKHLG